MARSSGWKGEQTGVGISGEVNGTMLATVSLPVTRVERRILEVPVPVGIALPLPVPVPIVPDQDPVPVTLGECVVMLGLVVSPVLVPIVGEALLGMTSSLGMKLDEDVPGPGPLPPFLTMIAFLTCKYISIQQVFKNS
jgi:hypothetical protein